MINYKREIEVGCVVVLEDEADIRRLLGDLLRMEGFSVVEVATSAALPRAILDVTPDIFLVDLMLPGASGMTVVRNLRHDGFPSTPIIALSASSLMCTTARQSGLFDQTIEKPFDIATIIESVEHYAA